MEQTSTELIVKSLGLLNQLYKNNIIEKQIYEKILPTLNIKSFNFVILRIYKQLLAFLGSNERITEEEYCDLERFLLKKIVKMDIDFFEFRKEDLHYVEFFNTEKAKHYQEYIKLYSAYDNSHPSFLL